MNELRQTTWCGNVTAVAVGDSGDGMNTRHKSALEMGKEEEETGMEARGGVTRML
jgi:hypothetical protein